MKSMFAISIAILKQQIFAIIYEKPRIVRKINKNKEDGIKTNEIRFIITRN